MAFSGYIGCCCCCKRTSIPYLKSYSVFTMVMSIIKILKYFATVAMMSEFAMVGPLLILLFLLNIATLVLSIILRCKAKRPNFASVKKLAAAMLILLSIEFFFTLIGVCLSSFDIRNMYWEQLEDADYGESDDYEQNERYRHRDHMKEHDFLRHMTEENPNLGVVLCALYSLIVFISFLVWQLYSSGILMKCAKYEINKQNGIEESSTEESTEESSEDSTEEEPELPRVSRRKRSKKSHKARKFEDNQKIRIAAEKREDDSESDYVEFEDSESDPSPPPKKSKKRREKHVEEESF